jgi:hypothetical protein
MDVTRDRTSNRNADGLARISSDFGRRDRAFPLLHIRFRQGDGNLDRTRALEWNDR